MGRIGTAPAARPLSGWIGFARLVLLADPKNIRFGSGPGLASRVRPGQRNEFLYSRRFMEHIDRLCRLAPGSISFRMP
jgi:hypothetical protein